MNSATVPPPKTAVYNASTSLSKKIPLPALNKWKVQDEDVAQEGHVIVYVKSKGLFLENYSSVKTRYACLTRHGYLVIYMKEDKGFIMNIPAATSIACTTDVSKKNAKRRCHIKIRYSFGNVHMWLLQSEVAPWRDALNTAYDALRRSNLTQTHEAYKRATAPRVTITAPKPQDVVILNRSIEMDEMTSQQQPQLYLNLKGILKKSDPNDSFLTCHEVSIMDISTCVSEPFTETIHTMLPTTLCECVDDVKVPVFPPMETTVIKVVKPATVPSVVKPVQHEEHSEDACTDSSNSGLFDDCTTTQESCRANPVFTVQELRSKLEAPLGKITSKKIASLDLSGIPKDFNDLMYWSTSLSKSSSA